MDGREITPAMRVLHVSHTAQRGGAELALVRLLKQPPRWSATVCVPDGGDAFDDLPGYGVPVRRELPPLPSGGTRSRDPVLAARYLAALRAGARVLKRSPVRRDTDLIHANTAAAAIVSALAGRRTAVPLVIHVRDLVEPASLGRFGFEAFTRIALRRADGIIANSHSTLRSAQPWIPSGVPRTVIQSPIGITRRVTDPQVNADVQRVGMIGRLQRWKGQHVFLRAFATAFAGTGVRAYLAGAPLFGETAYAEELHDLVARLGIAEQVTFLGHVEDIAGFLDPLDILVHASTRPEPLGQSVIQGLARAKPVIATEGGGPSEWIRTGVNGLLVPPDQPEALAAALRSLADSPELRARLAAAAAQTTGILGDDESLAAHAEFFHDVARLCRDGTRAR